MRKFIIAIGLTLLCFAANAQMIGNEQMRQSDLPFLDSSSAFSYPGLTIPSLYPVLVDSKPLHKVMNSTWLNRKLFQEDLVLMKDDKYTISINPVLDLRYGREGDSLLYQNTRGFVLNGKFGNNLFVRSEFYENQAVLPSFASDWVDTMKVIPGMINAKSFGSNGYDYGVVFSQIMWQPFKSYGVRLGYDRFHIGKGYRSMVLSDASEAYPFLMNTFTHKKWSLSHNIASLTNPDFNNILGIPRSETGAFQQKWFSFTYFTFSPAKWLNLGLYESVIFMPSDSTGISFYPTSMLPLPLVRTVAEKSKGLHHAMVALLADATIKEQLILYSQVVVDDINSNYQTFQGAFQLGFRWKQKNKDWPIWAYSEFNIATNNAYTSSNSWTAYTHYDQPLSHPSGQQFVEWASGFHFSKFNWLANIQYNIIWATGLPVTNSYFGTDSYSGNGFYAPQANPDKVSHLQMTLGYSINKTTNLVVFAGLHYRNYKNSYSDIPTNSLMYEIGIRHTIRRQYYDFF
ncbi:MAG: hypothetical protein CVU11_00375 [Bacteroidetes bacterium HGW-Bacteroidetes-6]|jgi:hypothetical protein|nr:MAG: hypothetical protein CVU11_00375 [Bacteroidetes bacterium HGW-Bacteroidetes-6]